VCVCVCVCVCVSVCLCVCVYDAILPKKGPITRAMAKRLQEDWAKDVGEGPRVLMSLRVDFGIMG